MATQLYETDFYGRAQEQAAKLRKFAAERNNLDVDFEHLADEIESVSGSDRKEVLNRLATIPSECPFVLEAQVLVPDDMLNGDGWPEPRGTG